MDFFSEYEKNILSPVEKKCRELEEKIIRKGIFATKKDKEKLERYWNLYNEKLSWYERQLDIETNN